MILVLAGVLYGVYVALNKPSATPVSGMTAGEVESLGPPEVSFDSPASTGLPAPPATLAASDSNSPAQLSSGPMSSQYEPGGINGGASSGPASSYVVPASGSKLADSSPVGSSAPDLVSSPEDSGSAGGSTSLTSFTFRRDWQQAEQQINAGKFRDALATLSAHYNNADLAPTEREQLMTWLDALAAKVIYSREHLLAAPYEVRTREALFEIADQHHVPWQLLMNVNRPAVSDPQILVPGTQLKIVPGPMRAEVHLGASEITLFLNELYAGRFPFTVGNEPPQPGEYKVLDKRPDRTYYGADGRTIPANDRTNPYGGCWIDLGHEFSIHGSPQAPTADGQTLGCISLSPHDAQDVYGILSRGSAVSIRR
jgi:lipoprotein-anchoring transpeptidase ErfK/SrfK